MAKRRPKQEVCRYLLCCFACCALLSFCSKEKAASQARKLAVDPSYPEVPLVMFHRYPAYSPELICGPIVGVWSDGRIVRVESEGTIGKSYVEGKLTAEQLQQLLGFIATQERLLELEGGYLIVDAASERLGIRLKDHCVLYEETVGDFAQFQHNADMAQLRQHLMSIEIAAPRPCDPPWRVPPDNWYE
ncbi:MAG: hypothetical protein JSV19_12680 [Phycisphaerales bacterium]|nr:MAG: hypothetical protein JSV19_12680 [Phycisphaerales bacterium]